MVHKPVDVHDLMQFVSERGRKFDSSFQWSVGYVGCPSRRSMIESDPGAKKSCHLDAGTITPPPTLGGGKHLRTREGAA